MEKGKTKTNQETWKTWKTHNEAHSILKQWRITQMINTDQAHGCDSFYTDMFTFTHHRSKL